MFELPKNDKPRQDDRLAASYVLRLLYEGKDMYKSNTSVIVYDDDTCEFHTDDRYIRKDIGYRLYDITNDVFDIVKDEITSKGWRLVKRYWSCPTGLNWSYRMKPSLSRNDIDNPDIKVIV